MTRRAYYNEIDAHAAQWLRNLISAGHLPSGEVDTRSIAAVQGDELKGFGPCHFFAGIGGWPLAARLAGVPDDWPLWTGSCPCQPFSVAGKGLGTADDRHLWPVFAGLIRERRPAVVAGEQVANAAGREWLDTVRADLEAMGFAVGAADLCAAGVGAPHIRQRLYWGAQRLADADCPRPEEQRGRPVEYQSPRGSRSPEDGAAGGLGIPGGQGLPLRERLALGGAGWREEGRAAQQPSGASGGLADAYDDRQPAWGLPVRPRGSQQAEAVEPGHGEDGGPGPTNGLWGAADWLACRDGRWRPVEPGTFPLAHGVPGRVGRLRAYGNAIVPQLEAEFLDAVMRCRP